MSIWEWLVAGEIRFRQRRVLGKSRREHAPTVIGSHHGSPTARDQPTSVVGKSCGSAAHHVSKHLAGFVFVASRPHRTIPLSLCGDTHPPPPAVIDDSPLLADLRQRQRTEEKHQESSQDPDAEPRRVVAPTRQLGNACRIWVEEYVDGAAFESAVETMEPTRPDDALVLLPGSVESDMDLVRGPAAAAVDAEYLGRVSVAVGLEQAVLITQAHVLRTEEDRKQHSCRSYHSSNS